MQPNTVEHNIMRASGASFSLLRSIFPKEFEFMYTHDSLNLKSVWDIVHMQEAKLFNEKSLHMGYSSSCFILISNECCINHGLFAQICVALASVWLSPLTWLLCRWGIVGGPPWCPPSCPQHLQWSGRRVQQACQTVTGPVGLLGFCFRNDCGIT